LAPELRQEGRADFPGREIAQHRDYSEATAILIDEQVKKLIQSSYEQAKKLMTDHSVALEKMAEMLLEREVLDGSEVLQIIAGKELAASLNKPRKAAESPSQQVIRPEGGHPR